MQCLKLYILIVTGPKTLSTTIKIELAKLKEVIGTQGYVISITSVDNP